MIRDWEQLIILTTELLSKPMGRPQVEVGGVQKFENTLKVSFSFYPEHAVCDGKIKGDGRETPNVMPGYERENIRDEIVNCAASKSRARTRCPP